MYYFFSFIAIVLISKKIRQVVSAYRSNNSEMMKGNMCALMLMIAVVGVVYLCNSASICM